MRPHKGTLMKKQKYGWLVAAYINGLLGVVGQQVRFRMPHTLEEAVQVAVTISNEND
jgi:hypothetical protein